MAAVPFPGVAWPVGQEICRALVLHPLRKPQQNPDVVVGGLSSVGSAERVKKKESWSCLLSFCMTLKPWKTQRLGWDKVPITLPRGEVSFHTQALRASEINRSFLTDLNYFWIKPRVRAWGWMSKYSASTDRLVFPIGSSWDLDPSPPGPDFPSTQPPSSFQRNTAGQVPKRAS